MKTYQKLWKQSLAVVMIMSLCFPFAVKIKAEEQVIDNVFVVEGTTLKKYTGKEETVVIPSGITKIGNKAFWNNDDIKTVILSDSVIEVGSQAFESCFNLERVEFTKNVKKIGNFAFYDCENVKEIVGLDGVEQVGAHAFAYTLWLEEKQKKEPIVMINTCVVDGRYSAGDVVIPDGATFIAENAFYGAKIKTMEIPDSVKIIEENALCLDELKTVKMGNGVEWMDFSVFESCRELENVRLSNSLKVLPPLTFAYCEKLEEVTIPDSVVNISFDAFYNCKNLKALTLPDTFEYYNPKYAVDLKRCAKDFTIYGIDVKNHSVIQTLAKEQGVRYKELALNAKEKTLKQGDTYRLKFNSGAKCMWSSSNPEVATVNYYGLIAAKEKGTATIVATLYGKDYTCKITVK